MSSAAVAPQLIPAAEVAAAEPDVRAYCAATLAPAQVFWVRPSRDTVLVGRQGTKVAVPANVWAVPAGSPSVRVELQEFYSTTDIILAGLSTRAGTSLLETGGMVNLTATVNQQPVALRSGRRLLLQMPTKRPLEGMQLFQDASAAGQHGTNWQLPDATPTGGAGSGMEGFELEKDGRWPQLAGGDKALLKFFDKRIANSRTIMARLRRYRPATDEEKLLLKESSKANRKKVLCAMRLEVKVDSTGAAYFAPLPYGDDELKATLLATARQLPKWRPARFRQLAAPHRLEKVQAVGVLTMLYTSGGKRLLGVQWDQGATHEPRFARYVARQRQEGRRQFAAQFASGGPLKLDESLYYEFEADGLGWINCDRFLEEGPRVEFTVQTPQPNTVVTLVFQQQRSILASSRTEQSAAVFAQVPTGGSATVVAVRREQGVTYLATTPVTLGQEAPPKLEFRPVSLTELRSALAQL